MASHALDQRLFERTGNLVGADESASPANGIDLIDGWLNVIKGNTSVQLIQDKLQALRYQLLADQPDADRVRELLLDLADDTSQIAQGSNIQEQTADKLEELATVLRQLTSSF